MSSIPKTMRAVVQKELTKAEVREIEVPKLEDNDVLVKVDYAAANPTDWKHIDFLSPPTSIIGCDFSGHVVSLGANPNQKDIKVGDRLAGFAHGGKFSDKGTFAEYARVSSDLVLRVPEGLKAEEAASFGVGYGTAALSVFFDQGNKLPPAKRDGDWFFVGGGSSSVGLFAIQLAKVAGYKVIATASPHSFDLLKSYGADHIVDYHDIDKAIEEVQKITSGGVTGGLECIGGDDNLRLAFKSFVSSGGKLSVLLPISEEAGKVRSDVEVSQLLLYMVGGYSFEFMPGKPPLPAVPAIHDWFVEFCKHSPSLIMDNEIKSNPIDLRKGIESVLPGLKELKDGKVSGKKLVFQL